MAKPTAIAVCALFGVPTFAAGPTFNRDIAPILQALRWMPSPQRHRADAAADL